MPRREAGGLAGALLAHAAVFLLAARALPLHGQTALEEPSTPVDVDIEVPAPSPSPQPEPSPSPAPPEEPATAAAHPAPARSRGAPPSSVENSAESAPVAPASSSSAQPFVFSPTVAPSLSSESLGMSGRNPFFGNVPEAPGTAGPPGPAPENNVAPGINKSMHDALAARDHELGFDTGGPLVAVLEDAARPSDTPENSRAVFEVTIDANGDVTGVRILDASQARQAWDRVASNVRATLRSRRIPLRSQGKGLIVTLEVRSRFTLPSGGSGGIDPQLNLDGTSPGAHVGFDLSDIGQRAKRDIHARILSERQP